MNKFMIDLIQKDRNDFQGSYEIVAYIYKWDENKKEYKKLDARSKICKLYMSVFNAYKVCSSFVVLASSVDSMNKKCNKIIEVMENNAIDYELKIEVVSKVEAPEAEAKEAIEIEENGSEYLRAMITGENYNLVIQVRKKTNNNAASFNYSCTFLNQKDDVIKRVISSMGVFNEDVTPERFMNNHLLDYILVETIEKVKNRNDYKIHTEPNNKIEIGSTIRIDLLNGYKLENILILKDKKLELIDEYETSVLRYRQRLPQKTGYYKIIA